MPLEQIARAPERDAIGRLVEARLWVARLGESDVHGWWSTDGILGEDGAFVGPRVLPRTHGTGRARIAMAVARHACDERHPDRKALHLFRLAPSIEDQVDAYLADRLGDLDYWDGLLSRLQAVERGADIAAALQGAGIVDEADVRYARSLGLGPGGRSVAVTPGAGLSETLRRLAAAFALSSPDQLAVPFIKGGSAA